ncbi:MAG: Phospholipase D1 [Cirrosporium novae-zelandiae]|nr:MAG: Phospholipase D1 [Cirrosporium novae-zelandiae]
MPNLDLSPDISPRSQSPVDPIKSNGHSIPLQKQIQPARPRDETSGDGSRPATSSSVTFTSFNPGGTLNQRNIDNEFPFGNGCAQSTEYDDTPNSTVITPQTTRSERPKKPDAPNTPGKRSVQFSRPEISAEDWAPMRPTSRRTIAGEGDATGQSLVSKFKAFTGISSPSGRSFSATAVRSTDGTMPPDFASPQYDTRNHTLIEEDSDADADSEESTNEEPSRRKRKRMMRRRSRRIDSDGTQTAPASPSAPPTPRPGFLSSHSSFGFSPLDLRPHFLHRRATTSDMSPDAEDRQGVSEDEGRSRLRESTWQRSRAWMHGPRGFSYAGRATHSGRQSPRRPSNFRKITGLRASEIQDGLMSPFKRPRPRGSRPPSFSAQRWRQIKASIKNLGQRKKAEMTIDHLKSAALVAELMAGAPAVIFLASQFQKDDHGHRRMPILLEQLKINIKDKYQIENAGDRHPYFRIELEYGSGETRMKWDIRRALSDFAKLHAKYKLVRSRQKYLQIKDRNGRAKLPHFPRSAFIPYLKGMGTLLGSDSEEEDSKDNDADATDGAGGTEKPKNKRQKSSISRRKDSSISEMSVAGAAIARAGSIASAVAGPSAKKEAFPEHQRKKLELYLQQLIRCMMFRPECNRLCRFFELSILGVRLASEGTYHGKEGMLLIQSSQALDYKKSIGPKHYGHKWFLVRHSYIVCVDNPESMDIYDVILVDCDFKLQAKQRLRDTASAKDLAVVAKDSSTPQHVLKIENSERKLRLLAKSEHLIEQFENSIRYMMEHTPWQLKNRYDSFAPPRDNVRCQWLVDGRDYFWVVSRSIAQAREVIYIHDWWLSPEIYLQRPPAISHKWRLDRLLKRKADEGVKIFIIMYRNVQNAIPIDSDYSKAALLELSPNVYVQRSPQQFRQNQFFWAHHEKLVLIDHMVAFVGGIDLCFGRWDSPHHDVVDDKLTGFENATSPRDSDHVQLWPGKDYSNPRVQDFYSLEKPYEEMYDRSKIPRMPWHDVHMQVIGQPARDLSRHFTQRWNFLLHQKKPSRPTPFLLPAPDLDPRDVEELGLDGTCTVQMLRSCTDWSIGTRDKTEHSIMNAYVDLIENSQHFVYIENQFFITTSEWNGNKIENGIGQALVDRIKRAAANGENWKAVILIPLIPGFQNRVDDTDGTSVRLIMECQYRSICRGETSIFGKLKAVNIIPENYIQFYSLRNWGRIGPLKQLVTEQLYIHAKIMVVDDRWAIIGSANINERSQLGSRDSECAALVYDTDMLPSTMGGKPFQVGRFPHTLRMSLMREHLGLDVDALHEEELEAEEDDFQSDEYDSDYSKTDSSRADTERRGFDQMAEMGRDGASEPFPQVENDPTFKSPTSANSEGNFSLPPPSFPLIASQLDLPPSQLPPLPALDDSDIGGPQNPYAGLHPLLATTDNPYIHKDAMKDPLDIHFFEGIWRRVAENNTKLYRTIFRCQPDNQVTRWDQYHNWMAYTDLLAKAQGVSKSKESTEAQSIGKSGPPGTGSTLPDARLSGTLGERLCSPAEKGDSLMEKVTRPLSKDQRRSMEKNESSQEMSEKQQLPVRPHTSADPPPDPHHLKIIVPVSETQRPVSEATSQTRRRRATTKSSKPSLNTPESMMINLRDANQLAERIQGHLIVFPYHWLSDEDWLQKYQVDRMAPLEI